MTMKEYIKTKGKEVKNHQKNCCNLAVEDMINKGYNEKKIKRMSIADKWLYYKIHIDKENKMPKNENIKWIGHIERINFLCNTEERYNNFINNYYGKSIYKNIVWDLDDFEEYQIKIEKRKDQVKASMLQECINNNEWDQFWNLMNELYMDNLYWGIIEETLNMIEQGLTTEDIYKWSKIEHFANYISFELEYVKERLSKVIV